MRYRVKPVLLLCVLLMTASTGFAQKVIEGTVTNAETGETLPSTNLILVGTYSGTITNRDGHYSLTIPDSLLPATVQVRYIGFTSEERKISVRSERKQDFSLSPSVSRLEEVVVTDEDPALSIMERVIRRKQQWRSKLNTYKAQAYTRQNLANDTALVMITESASKVYWNEEKGHREVLQWRRQTANIEAGENVAGVSYLPNFYDDNVEVAGFDVVGVTNPNALSYYNFKLLGTQLMDGQTVYHIKVIPKRKLQPLFRGEVYVLDETYALLKVNLKPNSVVRFPALVNDFDLSYEQQFNNYGGDFWLPVDARISGTIKIGMLGLRFPRMRFHQLSKISDYQVNIPMPDSLFKQENVFTVDSTAIAKDSLAAAVSVEPVPLSQREAHAYAMLDSTQTLEKAFKPHGFLARFVDMSDEDEEKDHPRPDSSSTGGWSIPGHVMPRARYNRVDELFAGLTYAMEPLGGLELAANGGYSTGYKKWSYGGEIKYSWPAGRLSPEFSISYDARTATQYESQVLKPYMASVVNILGYPNYFDYYRDEGFQISGKITDRKTDISLKADFNSSDQTSLETQTAYDIQGRNRTPRINPAINEGHINSIGLTAGYNLNEEYMFGVVGRKRVAISVEFSDDVLGSDFNYSRYSAHFDWSFPTFYKRRLFSNTLNMSLDAGTFSGRLPLQKIGIVDGTPGILSLFESLRTVRFRPYEGEQYAVLNMEHNFRTIPFERLGLTYLVEHNIGVIVFGGAARTWISDRHMQQIFDRTGTIPKTTNGVHLEAGISINSIFNLFRVDFAKRLDDPAFLIGVGITRFY